MDSAKLNDWLQVIGIFALVASLIFVGLQMKQTHLSAAYWLWIANDVGIIQTRTNVLTNAFAANIHRYPGIAKMNASKRRWSMEGSKLDLPSLQRFSVAIQNRLAELEKIEPNPLSDPDWCGNFS